MKKLVLTLVFPVDKEPELRQWVEDLRECFPAEVLAIETSWEADPLPPTVEEEYRKRLNNIQEVESNREAREKGMIPAPSPGDTWPLPGPAQKPEPEDQK